MKEPKIWPEIYVEGDFLKRKDLRKVYQTTEDTYNVTFDHPVLGLVTEIYQYIISENLLCLKSCFPHDMQSIEEMSVVTDYYNNHLLEGSNTYLEYSNKNIGWYILSRNVEEIEKPTFKGNAG